MNMSVVVLDCDGVVLDSNSLKTDAMAEAVSSYGPELQAMLIDYHRLNGGLSRYHKFEYFLKELVGKYSEDVYQGLLDNLSTLVRDSLKSVAMTEGAMEFIDQVGRHADLYIVSGGDQEELNEVFDHRGLSERFKGIYGSPVGKHEHCSSIMNKYDAGIKPVFFGDSKLDHIAATDTGMEFYFISGYTDFDAWRSYCDEFAIRHFPNLLAAKQHLSP